MAIVKSQGIQGLVKALRNALRGEEEALDYQTWILRHDTLEEADIVALRARVSAIADPPLISVVMPVYNPPEDLLRAAIESVRAQVYHNWELCIADDASPAAHVRLLLADYAVRDPRIKLVIRPSNGHISEATNSAFALASGAWVALMDHDDLLSPNALAEVALEIARHPDAELIYSDEDKIDPTGAYRFEPHFKPDFSRELFRAQNYLNHLTVHRAANIRAVGAWRKGFEGSQDYDLNLRIFERIDPSKIRHVPKILYHWRAVEGSTAAGGEQKTYAYSAGLSALQEHVARSGLRATAEPAPRGPFYRLRLGLPEPQPLASLIIPTRDRLDMLSRCIGSIRNKTTYANYEIIVVDNGSTEQETRRYLDALAEEPRTRVLRYDKPFNYAAINNFAVGEAAGTVIGLVNNDIEVISPDWLGEMISWATQPDIGCVGAKLYYADDTIQHAGVVLGVGGVANHAHLMEARTAFGYFGRAVVLNNYSAVTGACLVVRKSIYEEIGGLNEKDLAVAFNDVDFCLRVREAGYSNVWTPYAELYHLESVSRGKDDHLNSRFQREVAYMQRTWGKALQTDPFYSPHFSRRSPNFSIGG
ncbi:glycosyltransferase family 2 protein [Hyphomicrobium sp. CS1GBMeth3]|uniref:glycosyltransferase family 2 protein n=1 Tax=Hyphomicrobium sp. CS1GBMeth3 TaxID=1892845 RepID=UPI0009FA4ADA|nr:glycosyltransferase family 2 protein [Hyphomicrobium sp. CS1GBMeth3]